MEYVYVTTPEGHFGIVELSFWTRYKRLDDRYNEELLDLMEELGFVAVMENQFEYQGEGDPEAVLDKNCIHNADQL